MVSNFHKRCISFNEQNTLFYFILLFFFFTIMRSSNFTTSERGQKTHCIMCRYPAFQKEQRHNSSMQKCRSQPRRVAGFQQSPVYTVIVLGRWVAVL